MLGLMEKLNKIANKDTDVVDDKQSVIDENIKDESAKTEGKDASDVGKIKAPKYHSLEVDTEKQVKYQFNFSKQEMKWKTHLYQKLLDILDLSLIDSLQEEQVRTQIHDALETLMHDEPVPLSSKSRKRVMKQIEDEILGFGPLEPLLDDKSITDILVNGHDTIYVERAGKLELTDINFDDNAHLGNIIDRIVSSVGRRIDESSPMVDARLLDGSRVNAIIPPLAVDAPILSIRKFASERLGVKELISYGTLTPMLADVLWAITKARLNVIISGGTGSGKTTLLNIVSGFIPINERIVTIEDSAELQLRQPHVVRLETRPANIEDKGEVDQRDLVRNSLRMRPDRIILGEVRDIEAVDMLQAMNTGHDGSLTTIHANQPRDALARIENMVAMSGLSLPISAVRAQMASAINIIIQVARMEDGKRRVISLSEINGMEGNIISMTEIFTFFRRGFDDNGDIKGELRATGLIPQFYDRITQRGIKLDRHVFDPDSPTDYNGDIDA